MREMQSIPKSSRACAAPHDRATTGPAKVRASQITRSGRHRPANSTRSSTKDCPEKNSYCTGQATVKAPSASSQLGPAVP